MVPNIDPEQVRKLAGWGLTQNDKRAHYPLMQNEAGLTKATAHPRLRLWARPLRGPGGWVGDWCVWHAPDGPRARAATALGCTQASTQKKLGVMEASYISAIIGVERRLAFDKPVARSRQGISDTRAGDSQSLRKVSRPPQTRSSHLQSSCR